MKTPRPSTRSFYEGAVVRASDAIRAGLDQPLDLRALGKLAALAPLHFHRVFRGLTGETPLALHRRLRLERASLALATSSTSVTAIALDAGYETHEAFTRAFRAAFSVSPAKFRAAARAARTSWSVETRCQLASPTGLHFTSPAGQAPRLRGPQRPELEVVVELVPTLRVFALEHHGAYTAISETFARLADLAGPAGLLDARPQLVALYLDDPELVPTPELRALAGLVVSRHARLPRGLKLVTLPRGRYARALHRGPYSGLADAWNALLGRWLAESGHRLGPGPSFERYLNTPADVAVGALKTELLVPLR